MLGDIEGGTRRHSVNCGMTPRVFEYLFSRIQKVCSFLLHYESRWMEYSGYFTGLVPCMILVFAFDSHNLIFDPNIIVV